MKLLKGKRLIPVLLDNLSSNPIKLFFQAGIFQIGGFQLLGNSLVYLRGMDNSQHQFHYLEKDVGKVGSLGFVSLNCYRPMFIQDWRDWKFDLLYWDLFYYRLGDIIRYGAYSHKGWQQTSSIILAIMGRVHQLQELAMLTKWFQSTRLETRTKESNMYASVWVEKTLKREVKAIFLKVV